MKWHALASVSRSAPLRLARSDCGTLWIEVLGVKAGLRPSGALWLPEAGVLAAGDLHLEKGSSYARTGQLLPPYDTFATLDRLEAEICDLQPSVVALLGDSFHDAGALARLHPTAVRRLGALARRCEVVFILGNHDAPLGEGGVLPGRTADGLDAGPLRLRHDPLPGRQPGEVAGHLHPCARIRGGRRRPAFATDGERLILPAFGAYAGGLNIRHEAFGGLFCEAPVAGVLGEGRVHPIAYASLMAD